MLYISTVTTHQRRLAHPLLARKYVVAGVALAGSLLLADQAAAQALSLNFDPGQGVTERALQLIALVTVVALAPSILIMVTSFTRIVVVLSLLRTAIGVQQSPPNTVIVSLALFLTAFVMAPVFETAYRDGVRPLIENQVQFDEAFQKSAEPFRTFMLSQAREKDLALFVEMNQKRNADNQDQAGQPAPADAKVPLQVLVPAFVISELRRAFEIGFLLFIPFIVIDMVVASILMSMGMLMLPPIIISLPFKLIFFVLVDGWNLVTGSLVQSFGT
ncbi:MAG: flagellar type III secretion system pore protein FliP [Hyphomicrobiales bacterium]